MKIPNQHNDLKMSFRPYRSYKILLIILGVTDVILLSFSAYMLLIYKYLAIAFFCFVMIVLSFFVGIKCFQYYPLCVEITDTMITMKNMRTKEVCTEVFRNFQGVYILTDHHRTTFLLFTKEPMIFEQQKQCLLRFFSRYHLRLSLDGNICIAMNSELCKKIIDRIQNKILVLDQRNGPRI